MGGFISPAGSGCLLASSAQLGRVACGQGEQYLEYINQCFQLKAIYVTVKEYDVPGEFGENLGTALYGTVCTNYYRGLGAATDAVHNRAGD